MQPTIQINLSKGFEWGLNAQQALLFSFLYDAREYYAELVIDGNLRYWMSKHEVCRKLPIIAKKPDTAYRLMKQLCDAGLINLIFINSQSFYAITEKGEGWV